MKQSKIKPLICLLLSVAFCINSYSQQHVKVNWLSFEKLADTLQIHPKKIMLNLHTTWCKYCKMMDKQTFTDTGVINLLNKKVYAVKMDAETNKTITFLGKTFYGNQSSSVLHPLAALLCGDGDKGFPQTIIINEDGEIIFQYAGLLTLENLKLVLQKL